MKLKEKWKGWCFWKQRYTPGCRYLVLLRITGQAAICLAEWLVCPGRLQIPHKAQCVLRHTEPNKLPCCRKAQIWNSCLQESQTKIIRKSYAKTQKTQMKCQIKPKLKTNTYQLHKPNKLILFKPNWEISSMRTSWAAAPEASAGWGTTIETWKRKRSLRWCQFKLLASFFFFYLCLDAAEKWTQKHSEQLRNILGNLGNFDPSLSRLIRGPRGLG